MVCCSLLHRGEELLGQRRGLAAYAQTGKTFGVPLLHPWANRLGDWSYSALGSDVERRDLEGRVGVDSATGLPIHGTLPGPWRLVETAPAQLAAEEDVTAVRAFPFDHRLRLAVEVDGAAVRWTTTVEALENDVPVSFGFHPYLTLPGVPRTSYEIELPARRRLLLDERKLPSGETEQVAAWSGPLGDQEFDDPFDELPSPPAFAVSGGGRRISVEFEQGFPVAQVFAPAGQDLICFEPMTARANALRDGGFPVASPGEPFVAAFSISVASSAA
jgi:aldose 1-epimerase